MKRRGGADLNAGSEAVCPPHHNPPLPPPAPPHVFPAAASRSGTSRPTFPRGSTPRPASYSRSLVKARPSGRAHTWSTAPTPHTGAAAATAGTAPPAAAAEVAAAAPPPPGAAPPA